MSNKSSRTSNSNSQPSKRRKLSHTDGIANLLGPSRIRSSAVLPQRRPRPEVNLAELVNRRLDPNRPADSGKENETTAPAQEQPPLPKLVDSPLTSENIESALCLIDRNAKQKSNSFDDLLQAFHDLYRWSRQSNREHRDFFMNEFVWELSGISRVMKFLKAHKMGDEYLSQLLQTELPFNE